MPAGDQDGNGDAALVQDSSTGTAQDFHQFDEYAAEQRRVCDSRDVPVRLLVAPHALLQRPHGERVQHAAFEVVGPDQHPSGEVRK